MPVEEQSLTSGILLEETKSPGIGVSSQSELCEQLAFRVLASHFDRRSRWDTQAYEIARARRIY